MHTSRRQNRFFAAAAAVAMLAVMAPLPAQAANDSQPWRNPSLPPTVRAHLLLNALTFDEKVQVALDNMAPVVKYGVPAVLASHDGPSGIGLPGATSFPSAQTLAATFSKPLASSFGQATGQELRAEGRDIWLGPAVDIDRSPLSGRQAEALGEDPYLAGATARAEVQGAKSQHTIQTIKHYGAYTQEYARLGYQTDDPNAYRGRTSAINEQIPERALREIYEAPVQAAVKNGGADSVMCSYNDVNGSPACQNADLLGSLKSDWNGMVIPDFLFAQRDAVAAADAGVDLAGFDGGNQQRTAAMYTSGQISLETLNDSDFRVFYALFDSGLFDDPPVASTTVSTDAHKQLAAQISADGMVLLKNNGVLPLSAAKDQSIAVLGPSGADAMYTESGSAAVPTTSGTNITPLAGITARAGSAITVSSSQGSAGDVVATTLVPASVVHPSGPSSSGWTETYWDSATPSGTPTGVVNVPTLNLTAAPAGVTAPFSARWTSTLTPPETGLYRFTSLEGGDFTLSIDGHQIVQALKPSSSFFGAGTPYPVQATANLRANKPVTIQVTYSSVSNAFSGANVNLAWQTPSQSGLPAAVEAARHATTAIIIANFSSGEGADRTSLSLPGDQDALIEAVAAVNKNTVVVLNTGGPVLMPWLSKVAGVVEAWYPGQMFGQSLASVLFGDVNPSGHLPVTFPANDSQGPGASVASQLAGTNNTIDFKEGIFVGYRYYGATHEKPLFPFGYGLSYTSFKYSDLSVRPAQDGNVQVSFTVENTGHTTGTAVPQVYTSGAQVPGVNFAKEALVGYDGVSLYPGQSKRVTLAVTRDQFNYWSERSNRWVYTISGRNIFVGDSVDSLRLTAPATGGDH